MGKPLDISDVMVFLGKRHGRGQSPNCDSYMHIRLLNNLVTKEYMQNE
jgi:hypothetical protein